jgi:hypothetical protein
MMLLLLLHSLQLRLPQTIHLLLLQLLMLHHQQQPLLLPLTNCLKMMLQNRLIRMRIFDLRVWREGLMPPALLLLARTFE